MDHHAQIPNDRFTSSRKIPAADRTIPIDILLIGRDPVMRVYTDEVLRQAGFHVRAITPWEAKGMMHDGIQNYPLVVFSNTLNSIDISEIGPPLRHRNPRAKLLLMLGPDPLSANMSMFDATLEGLEGPAALIQMVRRLVDSLTMDGPVSMPA